MFSNHSPLLLTGSQLASPRLAKDWQTWQLHHSTALPFPQVRPNLHADGLAWPGLSLSSTSEPCPDIPGLCLARAPLIGPNPDPNVQADVPVWPQPSPPPSASLPISLFLAPVTVSGATPDSRSCFVLGLASVAWICLVTWALCWLWTPLLAVTS